MSIFSMGNPYMSVFKLMFLQVSAKNYLTPAGMTRCAPFGLTQKRRKGQE